LFKFLVHHFFNHDSHRSGSQVPQMVAKFLRQRRIVWSNDSAFVASEVDVVRFFGTGIISSLFE
jgi:hypothetical protein